MVLVPVAIVVAALYFGRSVFVPLALAMLFAFVLAPLVARLRAFGFNRATSVMSAVSFGTLVVGGIAIFVTLQAEGVVNELPQYRSNIVQKIQTIRGSTLERGVIARTSVFLDDLRQHVFGSRSDAGSRSPTVVATTNGQTARVQIAPAEPGPLEMLRPVVDLVAVIGIILLFVIFLLLQKEDLRDRFVRLVGPNDMQRTAMALDDGAQRLSRYLLMQTIVNATFGTAVGIGLGLIGLPSPALWGVTVGILRFVPYVGVPVAATLPLAVAFAVDPGWSMVLSTIAVFIVLEITVGQFVEPWLYGKQVGLSPAAIIISATFWTSLWGPVGLLLSTPLTMCLVVIGRYAEHLQFLDILLGDRPVLSTEEALYLRLLGDKADEAAAEAEEYLAENSIGKYFDDIAVKALALAHSDTMRGRLDYDRQVRIKNTVEELIQNLKSRAEPAPLPTATTRATIICLAGRGPLSVAATLLLEEALKEAEIFPQLVLSSAEFVKLDCSTLPSDQETIVCISSLEATPANARFLSRRVIQKLPSARVLLGCWSLSSSDPALAAIADATGLDVVTTSSDAVRYIKERLNGPEPDQKQPARAEAQAGRGVSTGKPVRVGASG
jgi:predicted PurR-regulated permease PerM